MAVKRVQDLNAVYKRFTSPYLKSVKDRYASDYEYKSHFERGKSFSYLNL